MPKKENYSKFCCWYRCLYSCWRRYYIDVNGAQLDLQNQIKKKKHN